MNKSVAHLRARMVNRRIGAFWRSEINVCMLNNSIVRPCSFWQCKSLQMFKIPDEKVSYKEC